jgi:hypothetical protein
MTNEILKLRRMPRIVPTIRAALTNVKRMWKGMLLTGRCHTSHRKAKSESALSCGARHLPVLKLGAS